MLGHLFVDRRDAGKQLGRLLKHQHYKDPVLLALPRGGIVVADEIAYALAAPVDVVIARKIGAPGHPEFGIGAISEDEEPSFNSQVSGYMDTDSPIVDEIIEQERHELKRRINLYRHGHELPDMTGKTVIVVDDGLATGVTAIAAAHFLRSLHPEKLVLAVPLAPANVPPEISEGYDDIICLYNLHHLRAIGLWYSEFDQIEDEEVLRILKKYH